MPFARIGEIDLHYEEEGRGPLIVLLHGFPEFSYSWRKQIPALTAAGFRVVAPDLRGYNESSKPADVGAYLIPELVKDVAGLIAQSGGAPCIVAGHDWGGMIAWYLAMLHPDLVRRLVILNVPHPRPFLRELRRSMKQKLRASYQLFFAMPVIAPFIMRLLLPAMMRKAGRFTGEEIAVYERVWARPRAVESMLNYYRALRRSRGTLRALLRRIDVPTLMIWGEREPVFTRQTTEDFGEDVPNLRIERIPHAGHFVQTDAPERVNQLLIEFAKETDGRASLPGDKLDDVRL